MKPPIIHDHVVYWSPPPIVLHDDAMVLAILLAWVLVGIPVYLWNHGWEFKPKPMLTLLCGPGVWMLAVYKSFIRRRIIVQTPPPLPKEEWKMPKNHERS